MVGMARITMVQARGRRHRSLHYPHRRIYLLTKIQKFRTLILRYMEQRGRFISSLINAGWHRFQVADIRSIFRVILPHCCLSVRHADNILTNILREVLHFSCNIWLLMLAEGWFAAPLATPVQLPHEERLACCAVRFDWFSYPSISTCLFSKSSEPLGAENIVLFVHSNKRWSTLHRAVLPKVYMCLLIWGFGYASFFTWACEERHFIFLLLFFY